MANRRGAKRCRIAAFLTILLVVVFGALPVTAQFTTASLGGRITDPSGAAVPAAGVMVRNTATDVTFSTTSQAGGEYLFPALPVGTYELTVTKSGFETYVQSGIVLTVNQAATQAVVLKVGAVAERVTVTANASLVTTTSPTTGQLVNQQSISNLPLNGRQAQSLVFLVPGANDVTDQYCGVGCEGGAYPGEQYANVNGGGPNGVNYQMDGADNNDTYMNTNLPFPDPDAIQEFNVQTGNMSAAYGNAISGVVDIVTKTGTNEFHGDAFDFLRNYVFDARNYFAPTRDTLKQNQFGGTLGGPIKKDKLFFFGSYQGTRTRTAPNGNIAFVPTAAERTGDFGDLCSTYGSGGLCTDPNGTQLTNPNTGAPIPYNNLTAAGLTLSTAAQNLVKYLPLPNAGGNELNYLGAANNTNDDQVLGRIDYTRGKHHISGKYFYTKFVEPAVPLTNNDILTIQSNANQIRVQTVSVNDAILASTNLLFNTWFGWNKQDGGYIPGVPFSANALGSKIAPSPSPQLTISVGGYFDVNGPNVGAYNRGDQTVREVVTWVKGRYQTTFGGEMLRVVAPISNQYLEGASYTFGGAFSGNNLADFMLGDVSTFNQAGGIYANITGYNWAAFIQEDWRATPRLTLNGGLRWQPLLPYTDSHNRLPCFEPGKQSTLYPNAPLGLLLAGDPGCPRGTYYSTLDSFAPRIGFAYRLTEDGKTSVRGGAGYYFQPPETLAYQDDAGTPPFAPLIKLPVGGSNQPVSFDDPYGSAGIANPFPQDFGPKLPPSNFQFPLPATLAYFFPLDFKEPEITIWNLTLERQLGESWLVRAAYFGNKGTHLFATSDQEPMSDINSGIYSLGGQPPYPNFGPIGEMASGYNSHYNALQLSLEKRTSYGLSFLADYTWAKALDDFSESVNSESFYATNPFDRNANYGLSADDIANSIKVSGTYQIPHFHLTGVADKLLNGWAVAPIITWRSGLPFSIMCGCDNSLTGDYVDRADFAPGATIATAKLNPNRSHSILIQEYFNPAAFTQNAPGTFGNTGKNILIGPGLFDTDIALLKNTEIGDRFTLEFRAEAFNAFNNVNFGQPDDFWSDSVAAGGSGTFGQILSAGNPRIMQLALKLLF
jgi:Carboxypeptidase regulatory-like domain/TonB-dependent Receptor Plug Domain/TonB dependent receptor